MLKISKKRLFLTHLNSFRYDNKRWTDAHAEYVKGEIKAYSPETEVVIPRYGEIYDFSI